MEEAFKNWENLHHVYIVKGSTNTRLWAVLETQLGFVLQANPDALSRELETFGIDEARELSAWAIKKSFKERKVAVISAESVTNEAQNALLKLFEEPSPNTYFFLTLPSLGFILPTLLSRAQVINAEENLPDGKAGKERLKNGLARRPTAEGKIFLESDVTKRLKLVNSILKNKDKEKAASLIREIAKNLDTKKVPKETIESVLYAEMAIRSRAPSMKMILELLALTV